MKSKITQYLAAKTGKHYEMDYLRFWKPSFYFATKSKFMKFLNQRGLTDKTEQSIER